MRVNDLRSALFGLLLFAIGAVALLLAYPMGDYYLWWLIPEGLALLLAGVGFVYIAFSKRFRTEQ